MPSRAGAGADASADAEVAVVGAGPAGTACAIRLLERGHEVVLVDQSAFPRDKPCGDGLTASAVATLERLGLGAVVAAHQPIAGVRFVERHGRELTKRFSARPGRGAAAGACVPRAALDAALLDEALRRGARLVRARVDAPVVEDGRVRGIRYKNADGAVEDLRARRVVAADGATSRLRRALFGDGAPVRGRSYAARAYFRTERPLDPLFDVHLPLELDGRMLPGYAWVFPLGEHRANIGVGFFGGAGARRVSVRRMFEAAVAGLRAGQAARLGDVEQESALLGSPLATRFSGGRCRYDGIVFTGDAANTVDPLSGEGIAYALHGAELVADAVHDDLAFGTSGAGLGRQMARRFPRLGQEPWRMFNIISGVRSDAGFAEALREPFLAMALRAAAGTESDPSLRDTPVGWIAARHGDAHADAVERLDAALHAATETSSPLIAELVGREIRGHGGPLSAATALFALLGLGGRVDQEALDFAAALALSEALPGFVLQMSDRGARTELSAVNDRLVVMATDFVVSRAAVVAARCRSELLALTARTAALACEGQMLRWEDRGLRAPRHAERVAATAGGQFALAALGAAVLAGSDAATRDRFEAFGFALGCCQQVADELVALLTGDEQAGSDPGAAARRGFYCLSVLDVARRDGDATARDAAALVAATRADARAHAAAARVAERHGAHAKDLLAGAGLADPAPLEALVDVTLTRMRTAAAPARVPVPAGRHNVPSGSGWRRARTG